MKFLDEARIFVQSGRGGDGSAAARREAGAPFGGPSGGNGGRGGSVILQASANENTLLPFKYTKKFLAKNGENGRRKDQFGADAPDTVLRVPIGTLVRDAESHQILFHFTHDGQQRTAAHGGLGGLGNINFKTSTRQFPNFALHGEPATARELFLELQLFADLALIGAPSVGKSSIINAVAHTQAKVADYPFTTLVPHLGAVKTPIKNFNLVDIPGLIEWAADGRGLGNHFLRHIRKAHIRTLVADCHRFDAGLAEIPALLAEIFKFHQNEFGQVFSRFTTTPAGQLLREISDGTQILSHKIIQILLNKSDLIADDEILDELSTQLTTQLHKFVHDFTAQISTNWENWKNPATNFWNSDERSTPAGANSPEKFEISGNSLDKTAQNFSENPLENPENSQNFFSKNSREKKPQNLPENLENLENSPENSQNFSAENLPQKPITKIFATGSPNFFDENSADRTPQKISSAISRVSAATHAGLDERLHATATTLADFDPAGEREDLTPPPTPARSEFFELPSDELQTLVKTWALDEQQAQFARLRQLDDAEISRLIFQLPRGNDEAEQRFRENAQLRGRTRQRESAGARTGDVFKVISRYPEHDDRFIQF